MPSYKNHYILVLAFSDASVFSCSIPIPVFGLMPYEFRIKIIKISNEYKKLTFQHLAYIFAGIDEKKKKTYRNIIEHQLGIFDRYMMTPLSRHLRCITSMKIFQFKYQGKKKQRDIDAIIQYKNTTHCFGWLENCFIGCKMKRI